MHVSANCVLQHSPLPKITYRNEAQAHRSIKCLYVLFKCMKPYEKLFRGFCDLENHPSVINLLEPPKYLGREQTLCRDRTEGISEVEKHPSATNLPGPLSSWVGGGKGPPSRRGEGAKAGGGRGPSWGDTRGCRSRTDNTWNTSRSWCRNPLVCNRSDSPWNTPWSASSALRSPLSSPPAYTRRNKRTESQTTTTAHLLIFCHELWFNLSQQT